MKVQWGVEANSVKQSSPTQVIWDSEIAVNPHMLIMGISGSGKTYNLRKIISEMCDTNGGKPIRFHIMDVHGDIDIPNASSIMFSEQTTYGMNPLRINPNPHYGGVRKRVQSFINTINRVGRALGPKQEAALRNILYDIYAQHGFRQDDPTTWYIDDNQARLLSDGSDNRLYLDVPKAEKDQLKELKVGAVYDPERFCWWIPPAEYKGAVTRWSPKTLNRTHPSIADTLRMARHIMQKSFLGTNMESITNLEIANKAAAAFQRKLLEALKRGEHGYEDDKLQADLDKAKQKAIDTFSAYADSIITGRELGDLMKYDSIDVLKSVVDRLENLDAIGIFKPTPPPFDTDASVWRYHIKALNLEERKLFALFKMEELFAAAVQSGEKKGIDTVIIVDEAHIYADDDPENIMSTISKEARKFGLALIAASQAPTHFTDDFLATVATKIVLGIDETYWPNSARKMQVSIDALKWVKIQQSMLIQLKQKGATKNDWRWTLIRK